MRYQIFTPIQGYGYAGIGKIAAAVLLVSVFYALPPEHTGRHLRAVVDFCARYTMGIYAMHLLIGRILSSDAMAWTAEMGQLGRCALIYAVCFGLSFLGDRIVGKTWLRGLFR